MSIISKINSIKFATKRVLASVRRKPFELLRWLSSGYFGTKISSAIRTAKNTFSSATHVGYMSSGLVRQNTQEPVLYISDVDGTSIIDEFKSGVEDFMGKYKDTSPMVRIVYASGMTGMYMRVEMMFFMIYGGIPFILPIHQKLDGTDEHDAEFEPSTNGLLSKLANLNFDHVVSLGNVDSSVNVTEYVLNYAKHSPIVDSNDIDINLVNMAIRNGTIQPISSLYLPGGYLYDIYSVDPIVGQTLRLYKDFTQPRPTVAVGREIILVGGDPDVIYVGTQAAPNGFVYDVWVPNESRYYNRAKKIVESGQLPLATAIVDDDDYIEAYAILVKILHELDEEVNGPSESDDVPDVIATPDNDDEDEVPVLIDLPEYLR